MISRRRLLYGAATAATLAVGYPVVIEPRWFELTKSKVRIGSGADRVRVLHLSDLHASWAVPLSSIRAAITQGLRQRPVDLY